MDKGILPPPSPLGILIPGLVVADGGNINWPDPLRVQRDVELTYQQQAKFEEGIDIERGNWKVWARETLSYLDKKHTEELETLRDKKDEELETLRIEKDEELDMLRIEKEEERKFTLIQSALLAEAKDKEGKLYKTIQSLREEIATLRHLGVVV